MVDDLIKRRYAIEAMEDVDWYHINSNGKLVHGANSKEDEPLYKAEDVYKVLNDVPSTQPEIVRCKDCKHRIEHKHYGDLGESAYTCEGNMVGWILPNDFCSKAERRNDE